MQSKKRSPWCVEWTHNVTKETGWCKTTSSDETQGHTGALTACGMVVVFPGRLERRRPTCQYCKEGVKHPIAEAHARSFPRTR